MTIYEGEEGRFKMFASKNFNEDGSINSDYILSNLTRTGVINNVYDTAPQIDTYCDLMAMPADKYEMYIKIEKCTEQFEQEGKVIDNIIFNETAFANELQSPYIGVSYIVGNDLEYWVFGAKFDSQVSVQELIAKLYEVYAD